MPSGQGNAVGSGEPHRQGKGVDAGWEAGIRPGRGPAEMVIQGAKAIKAIKGIKAVSHRT